MAKLSVDKALLKAKSHGAKGEILEAQNIYERILQMYPKNCLLYTSPSPRDGLLSRMPSSA